MIWKTQRLAAALAVGIAAALAWTSSATAQNVTWNFSFWGKKRAVSAGIEEVARLVDEGSGGKFKIKIHYGEALSKAKENLDGIKLGAFEMAAFCSAYHPSKTPSMSTLDLPFLPFGDLDVQQAVHEAFYKHPAVLADLKRWNAIPYMTALLPQYEFMGVGAPPKTLADWEGKRVRALGGLGKAMAKLGAVPTTVPAPETYQLLERGTVDAVSWPFTYAHAAYKVDEISKWFTGNMSPGAVTCPLVINTKAWDALPLEYRRLLNDAKGAGYEALKSTYKAADEKNLPRFRKNMQEVVYSDADLQKFREVGAQPVWDEWMAEMEAKGVPGKELLEFVLTEAEKAS